MVRIKNFVLWRLAAEVLHNIFSCADSPAKISHVSVTEKVHASQLLAIVHVFTKVTSQLYTCSRRYQIVNVRQSYDPFDLAVIKMFTARAKISWLISDRVSYNCSISTPVFQFQVTF